MLDHFYCTDPKGELASQNGYELEGITGYLFKNQTNNTVPFYRLYHTKRGDHFYTTSLAEAKKAIKKKGYKDEGILGYVANEPKEGFVPLYRRYRRKNCDHFYTTSLEETTGRIRGKRYKNQGIACYIPTTQIEESVPFFRWYQSGIMTKFTFDDRILDHLKVKLYERHSFGHHRIKQCTHLTEDQKNRLLSRYHDPIHHDLETRPDYNASAYVGGSLIKINFRVLFPQGDVEIARTLIHEMMHCVGEDHPKKRPCTNDPAVGDCSGDGGPYFGSPPLMAEGCITGSQRSVNCVGVDGMCAIRAEN